MAQLLHVILRQWSPRIPFHAYIIFRILLCIKLTTRWIDTNLHFPFLPSFLNGGNEQIERLMGLGDRWRKAAFVTNANSRLTELAHDD